MNISKTVADMAKVTIND